MKIDTEPDRTVTPSLYVVLVLLYIFRTTREIRKYSMCRSQQIWHTSTLVRYRHDTERLIFHQYIASKFY